MEKIILEALKKSPLYEKIQGWSLDEIQEFEKKYLENRQYPQAIRYFLELAGNTNPITHTLNISDFYGRKGIDYQILTKEISDAFTDQKYCIIGYYSQGGFVWFVIMDGNDNPCIYINEYVYVCDDTFQIEPFEKIVFRKATDDIVQFIEQNLK